MSLGSNPALGLYLEISLLEQFIQRVMQSDCVTTAEIAQLSREFQIEADDLFSRPEADGNNTGTRWVAKKPRTSLECGATPAVLPH